MSLSALAPANTGLEVIVKTRTRRTRGLLACGGRLQTNQFISPSALAAMVVALVAAHVQPSLAAGDPVRGEQVYQGCMDCHSLDENSVGPRHADVFGRRAGAVPDYRYSNALKSSAIVWNEETLDRWLTDPQALVPGTKMFFSVPDARDRADLIAFLKKVGTETDQRAAAVHR